MQMPTKESIIFQTALYKFNNIFELDTYLKAQLAESPELKLNTLRDSDPDGYTLLHYAVRQCKLELVKYFVENKIPQIQIPCNISHSSTNTLMHYAALWATPATAASFINIMLYLGSQEHGANRLAFNVQHKDGGKPMHSCAFSGALKIMKFLNSDTRIPFAERTDFFNEAAGRKEGEQRTPLEIIQKVLMPNLHKEIALLTNSLKKTEKSSSNNRSAPLSTHFKTSSSSNSNTNANPTDLAVQKNLQQINSKKTLLGYLETMATFLIAEQNANIIEIKPEPK